LLNVKLPAVQNKAAAVFRHRDGSAAVGTVQAENGCVVGALHNQFGALGNQRVAFGGLGVVLKERTGSDRNGAVSGQNRELLRSILASEIREQSGRSDRAAGRGAVDSGVGFDGQRRIARKLNCTCL
jgi:hypothetical protein